jgi:hypothetical protein
MKINRATPMAALLMMSLSFSCRSYRAWRYDNLPILTVDQAAIYPRNTTLKVYGRITSFDVTSGIYTIDHNVRFRIKNTNNNSILKHNTEVAVVGRIAPSDSSGALSIVDVFTYFNASDIPTDQLQAARSASTKDSDGDGMTDYWEIRYGLNPNNNLDANEDPDDDSLANKTEFTIQTNPNLPNSIHIVSPEEFEH